MSTQTKTRTVRAALYGRKSSEDVRNPGKSVADQLREARAEAEARGYVLDEAHVFADDGVSASRFTKSKRPRFAALVTALENREVDVVVMAEQSRSARRMSVIGTLVELCAENGQTLVIGGRAADPRNPADLVMIGVQAGMDAAESERTSERSRRGARGAAEAGLPAGKNMYGYSRTYDPATRRLLAVEPVAAEAAVVREIVTRLLAGDSLYEVAQDLNTRGEPSPYDAVAARCGRETKGAEWVGTQVRRVALSPSYAGLRVHRGALTPAVWPAIVTEGEHERVTALLTNPARRTNGGIRPGAIVHWLSGVARCGECGMGMRVTVNRGTWRTYVCGGCTRTAKAADALEEYVAAHIFAIVARPDTLAAIAAGSDAGPAQSAVDLLGTLTARRDNVRSLVVAGTMPPEDGAAMLSALSGEIDAAEKAVRSIVLPRTLSDVVTPDLQERWQSFSPARKKEVASALVDVTVLSMHGRKSRTFDPATVLVTPKGVTS